MTKSKRVHYCLFSLLLIGAFSGCAARVKGPGIQFASEKYDFGSVPGGEIVHHDFEFTNNGTETLLLPIVAAMSDRTFVRGFDKEAEPGKGGKVSVSLNTKGLEGKVTEAFQVGTNVPDKPNITLIIEGTVKAGASAAGANKTGGSGPAFWRVQTGETVVGASPASSKQVKIVFAEAFSGIPKIVATVRNEPGWNGEDAFAVTVRGASNTEFVATIARVDKALPWTQSPLLDWTAWE